MTFRKFFPLLLIAPLGAAAQLPLPPPPPDPIEVVRKFFKLEPPKLETLKAQSKLPDVDLPNALWVAQQAGLSPEVVLNARISGLSWLDIFVKFKVPVERVVIADERAQCPPYGKAWGFRKKHGRRGPPGATAELKFSDAEISEFIQLRAAAGVYGRRVEDLAARRCAGRGVREIIEDEDDREHGRGRGHDKDKRRDHDDDHDNGNGRGKKKGHDKD